MSNTFGTPYYIVKCNSHRARDKAMGRLSKRRSLHPLSFSKSGGRGMFLVTPAEFELVKGIKGVSRTRIKASECGLCWSSYADNEGLEEIARKQKNELEAWEAEHFS